MTEQKLIKAAIEGGWEVFDAEPVDVSTSTWPMISAYKHGIIKMLPLDTAVNDPKFWQAAGKSLGWEDAEIFMEDKQTTHDFLGGKLTYPYYEGAGMMFECPGGLYRQYQMMAALWGGSSIEDFIKTL